MASQSAHTAAFEFRATPDSSRRLRAVADGELATIRVVQVDGSALELPEELAAILLAAIREAAQGHDLALVPREAEISPAKAGELIGVSRQYVDRLIETGTLPVHRIPGSTHRKVLVADVLAIARERDRRQKLIADMVDTTTDAGAEY